MKKRVMSLFLAFAMVVSIIPMATITTSAFGYAPNNQPYKVRLQARGNNNVDWVTNETPFKSTQYAEIELDGGPYTLTIDNFKLPGHSNGMSSLVSLSIMTEGATFEDDGFWQNGVDDYQLPPKFHDSLIVFEKVIITDHTGKITNALEKPARRDLLAPQSDPAVKGGEFVLANIWNGWHTPHQSLTNVVKIPGGNDVGSPFRLPTGFIAKIEVTFSIMSSPPAHLTAQDESVSVVLAAREHVDFSTDPNFWESEEPLEISENGTYELRVNTPGNPESLENPDGYDRIAQLSILPVGADFHEQFGLIGRAQPAPTEYWDDVRIDIIEVILNEDTTPVSVGNNWGNDYFVSRGDPATEGYTMVNLWNAWHTPSQLLTGVTKLGGGVGNTTAMGFAIAQGTIINSITVKFEITQIGGPPCLSHPYELRPCEICTGEGLCGNGCGETPENCVCCNGCKKTIDTCTCEKFRFKRGYIRGNDIAVGIGDVLQLLMFLAKLPNTELRDAQKNPKRDTRAWHSAFIATSSITALENNPATAIPTISDALQILMHLANIKTGVNINGEEIIVKG